MKSTEHLIKWGQERIATHWTAEDAAIIGAQYGRISVDRMRYGSNQSPDTAPRWLADLITDGYDFHHIRAPMQWKRDKVAEAYQGSLDAASYYRTACWSTAHGFPGFSY